MIISAALLVILLTFSISAKTVKLGDVSGDGKITASDARKILRFAATLDTCDEETRLIADVDSNGKVVASDARKVLRVAAHLDEEFGEITIGEETEESTTVNRTELRDSIGISVSNFMKQYGSMSKDGTTDGSTMYHNDQLVIVSDPKMIDDLKINSITVTGADYTLNGIYAGMTADEAANSLDAQGWKVKTSESNLVVCSKNSDLMKLTVRNGNITQVELCLAVSIATNLPSEPTTQEPTTQEPTTTPPEESTTPDNNNYLTVDELPQQVGNFLSGTFGFTGTIINAEGNPSDVSLYTNGNDMCIDLVMEMTQGDPVDVRVLIQDSQNSPKMFMINSEKKKYANFNPALFGGSIDDFKVGVNVGDINSAKITCDTQTIDNTEYEVYSIETPTGVTRFYTVNEEIKRIATFDFKGNQLSSIEIKEFHTTFPDGIFSLSQYTWELSFLLLFA